MTEKRSWFNEALGVLKVEEEPGWPDKFGKRLSEWIQKRRRQQVSTLSLFTGAGGLDIGFHDVGFNATQMVEIDERFVATLDANTKPGLRFEGSEATCIDIRNFNPSPKLKVEFIIGGPPCQTFSSAGRRASGVQGTDDPRGMLFLEYVRLLRKLKPKGFLFENVYGITGAQGGRAWAQIQEAFADAGYKIFYKVLDAADYGAPQHRERLFIVGVRKGEFKFPYPTHGPDSEDNRPYYSAGKAVTNIQTDEMPKKVNGRYGYLLDEIPPGLNYSFFTAKLGYPRPIFAWRSKFSDFLYKADPGFPVRAIKAQGGQYTGPFSWENRPFTVAEFKRLQTIPDNYQLVGGRQVAIHQIGNSVPSQVARILALAILDQIFKVELPFEIHYMPKEFKLSFRNRKRLHTERYERKAAVAIRNLAPKILKRLRTGTKKEIWYLGPNFEWNKQPGKGYYRAEIQKKIKDKSLELTMGNRKRRKFVISIQPVESTGWDIEFKSIRLVSYGCEKKHLTCLWRCLEEEVRLRFGVADLVQLSGYYQYVPRVRSTFYYHNSDKKAEAFWSFLGSIIEARGAIQIDLNKPDLFNSLDSIKIDELLKELRMLGYEVRNRNTNPQIREGAYLIPYSFPTLKPESVQLKKNL